MKNNKNVRKDNLSPVDNSTKRVYKMYKSKKNWVVAPVVLLTLLGAVAPAPIALSNVVNATETTVTTELDAAKSDVTNKIKGLGLSDEATLLTSVKEAKTAEDAFVVLKGAYTKAVEAQITDFNKKADEEIAAINKVENLGDDAATYTGKVTAAKTAVANAFKAFKDGLIVTTKYHDDSIDKDVTRDNYVDQRKAFDAALAKQTPVLTSALAEAKAQAKLNSDYEAKKADVIAQINKLANLTAAEKDVFLSQVSKIDADYDTNLNPDKIDWIKKLQGVLEDAQKANTDKLNAELATAKAEAQKALNEATSLSATAKESFQKQIDGLKDPAKADALVKSIKDADAKAKFEAYKKALVATFNSTSLSESQRKDFVNQANNATTYEELANIELAYNDAVTLAQLNTKSLKDLKADVTNKLDNALLFGGLTTLEKGDYQFAVKIADSKDAVINIFKEAQAKSREAISAAKADATEVVNGLKFLSESDKADALKNIQSAKTVSQVKVALDNAKARDTRTELDAAIRDTKRTVNKMKYLSASSAANLNSRLDAAKNTKEVAQILTDATEQNLVEGLNTTDDIVLARELGKEALNYLPNLSDTEKANSIKDMDAAKDVEGVRSAYETVKTVSEENTKAKEAAEQLAKAKSDAVNTVNGYEHLSAEQKADYVAKIKAARNTTELEAAKKEAADAESKAAAKARALSAAKQEAMTYVNNLKYLTESQKDDFVAQILRASTVDAVASVRRDADNTNFDQIPTTKEFLEAIDSWLNQDEVSNYLNKNQKIALTQAVKDAKDLASMKQAYKDAIAKADAQNDVLVMKELDNLIKEGLYETAKTKLAELRVDANKAKYSSLVDGLLALRDAKAKAQSEIEKADYASAKEKEGLLNSLAKADSIDGVNKVLDQLHALQPAEVVLLYRAYNPNSGEHLYTADKAEYDKLVGLGWHGEGNAWKAASKGAPVYRLYNPNSGEHFYTISESEYNDVAAAGWKKEGVAFYSDNNRGVEVYRLFNPNAKGAGSHHYTTLASERDTLIKAGWKYENVAFYGLK